MKYNQIPRTLKNIAIGALIVPLLTGFGAYVGEQLRIRYNPEQDSAAAYIRAQQQDNSIVRKSNLNIYTTLGGLAGLAVATVCMTMEIKRGREIDKKKEEKEAEEKEEAE